MFEINFQRVLTMLVEHELPKTQPIFNNGEITRDGIYIDFILKASNYSHCENRRLKETSERFIMLFCGDVSVFYAPVNKLGKWIHSPSEIPVSEWINSNNHDSCWNTDGFNFINDTYFKMCKNVVPDVAPMFVDTSVKFTSFSYPVKKCKIVYKRKNGDSYRNEIVKVIPIKTKE